MFQVPKRVVVRCASVSFKKSAEIRRRPREKKTKTNILWVIFPFCQCQEKVESGPSRVAAIIVIAIALR